MPTVMEALALFRSIVLGGEDWTPTAQRAFDAAMEALDPENMARSFHEAYERLAPEFGYATRPESAVPWDQVPEQNRRLMVATCAKVLATERTGEREPVVEKDLRPFVPVRAQEAARILTEAFGLSDHQRETAANVIGGEMQWLLKHEPYVAPAPKPERSASLESARRWAASTVAELERGEGALLSCPFCGSPAKRVPSHDVDPEASPPFVGCGLCDVWFSDAAAWNRRAASPEPGGRDPDRRTVLRFVDDVQAAINVLRVRVTAAAPPAP